MGGGQVGEEGCGELHLGFPIHQTSVIPVLSLKIKAMAAPDRPEE